MQEPIMQGRLLLGVLGSLGASRVFVVSNISRELNACAVAGLVGIVCSPLAGKELPLPILLADTYTSSTNALEIKWHVTSLFSSAMLAISWKCRNYSMCCVYMRWLCLRRCALLLDIVKLLCATYSTSQAGLKHHHQDLVCFIRVEESSHSSSSQDWLSNWLLPLPSLPLLDTRAPSQTPHRHHSSCTRRSSISRIQIVPGLKDGSGASDIGGDSSV